MLSSLTLHDRGRYYIREGFLKTEYEELEGEIACNQ